MPCLNIRSKVLVRLATGAAVVALMSGCAAVQTMSDHDTTSGVLFPNINGEPQPMMAEAAPMAATISSEQLTQPMAMGQEAMAVDPLSAPGPVATSGGSQRVPLGSLNSPAAAQRMIAQPMAPPAPRAPDPLPPEAAMAMSAEAARAANDREYKPLPAPINAPAAEEATRRAEREAAANQDNGMMREFIPASMNAARTVRDESGVSLSAADRNIMRRFETLKRLRDEELITVEEYEKRRSINVGGLLPYTKPTPGMGLDRPVPTPEAIIARIAALGRSLEMRAITPRQHQLERSMILNALLPEAPDARAPRRPPPADFLEAAAMVGKLETLRVQNLISEPEFDAEAEAIDEYMRTGHFPGERMAERKSKTTAAEVKPASTAPAKPVAEAPITGPLLHLASFRNEESAMRGWAEAQAKAGPALADKRPVVRKVDLGAKQGIFYRLMTGPFANLAAAEQTCVELKKVNQFCRASEDGQ